jgi:hypothetical protein
LRKILTIIAAAAAFCAASPGHAAPRPTGIPADRVERAYTCVGMLWAVLEAGERDLKAATRMDRAAVHWLEDAEKRSGQFLEDGESNATIDAGRDAYNQAAPDLRKAWLAYCLANAPA